MAREFTYGRKLTTRGIGRTLQVQLTYPSLTSASEQITIGRSR